MKKCRASIGKYLYFDWLIPVHDYFCTVRLKTFTFDTLLPAIIAVATSLIYQKNGLVISALKSLIQILPNVLAILTGFTISAITVIISGENEKILELQKYKCDKYIDEKSISLYQYIFITLVFVLLQEVISLIFVFVVAFLMPLIDIWWVNLLALCIFILSILNVFAIIVRAVVYLYTSYFNPTQNKR